MGSATLQRRLALRWRPDEARAGRRLPIGQALGRDGPPGYHRVPRYGVSAGLRVNSTSGTSQMFLTYRYALKANDRTQIGAALGLGIIFLRQEITATAVPPRADPIPRSWSTPAREHQRTHRLHRRLRPFPAG